MSAAWKKKWRRKPEKEKNQIVMVVVVGIIAAYAAGIYQFTFEDHKKTINMYNRQQDRLKKKKAVSAPKVINTGPLKNKLKSLDAQIIAATDTRKKLGGNFVPLEEKPLLRLRLAINSLAEQSQMSSVRLQDAGLTSTRGKTASNAPVVGQLENVTNNPYGRPLINLRARGSYSGLLNFFQALPTLSYNVTILRYGVFVRESKKDISPEQMLQVSARQSQPLEINILLAL